MKKIIPLIALIALLVIAGCTSTPTGNVVGPKKEDIKIGFIGPLTGDASAYGIPLQQVIEIAVKEINSQGGVDGRQLKVIYEDGKCTGKDAASAAQKLVNIDGVKVILGGLCSGETLGAAPVTESNRVILFSAASGSPDITNAGDYVFRNFPSDATSGSKVAQAAIENGHKKIAIMAEQTAYAQAVKEVFKETLKNLGGEVLIDEAFLSESSDFRSQITKIKSLNPEGVYLISQSPAKYGLVLKQLRELGLTQQLYTNEFASAQDILDEYPEQIEGAIFAEPAFDANSPGAKGLFNKIELKYGEVSGALPPVYLATTYDAVYILKTALQKCGEDTSCIKSNLYSIQDRLGIAGPLSIDSNGDAQFEYILKRISNGKPSIG